MDLASKHLLDGVRVMADALGETPARVLTLLALLRLNLAGSRRLAESEQERLDFDWMADGLSPVPILHLARHMAAPYESSRRRVVALAEVGLVEMRGDGCRLHPSVPGARSFRTAARSQAVATRALIAGDAAAVAEPECLRPFLDGLDFMVDALVAGISRTRLSATELLILHRLVGSGRRSVATLTLSQELGLPHATVRRVVAKLEARGCVRRTGAGAYAEAAAPSTAGPVEQWRSEFTRVATDLFQGPAARFASAA